MGIISGTIALVRSNVLLGLKTLAAVVGAAWIYVGCIVVSILVLVYDKHQGGHQRSGRYGSFASVMHLSLSRRSSYRMSPEARFGTSMPGELQCLHLAATTGIPGAQA